MVFGLSNYILNSFIPASQDWDDPDDTSMPEGFDDAPVPLEKCYYYAGRVADISFNVSESLIGGKLLSKGKVLIATNVGKSLGAAFPEATLAYGVGKEIAKSRIAESANKSKIVEGTAVLSAAAVVTVLKTLPALGIQTEYWKSVGYVLSTAGAVMGGRIAYEAIEEEIPANLIERTAASMVASSTVSAVFSTAQSIPFLPAPLVFTMHTAGKIAPSLVGTAVYNADHVSRLADNYKNTDLLVENLYDPLQLLQNIIKSSNKSPEEISRFIADKLTDSDMLKELLEPILQHAVEKKVAVNGLVRALNEYLEILQKVNINEKITALQGRLDEGSKEALKQEIVNQISGKLSYAEKIVLLMHKPSNNLLSRLPKLIVEMIGNKERKMISVELSNKKQMEEYLDVVLPPLISLALIHVKREVEVETTKDLSTKEIENFYQNLNQIIFAPYRGSIFVRVVQKVIGKAIPGMQKHTQFIPLLLTEVIGPALASQAAAQASAPRKISRWTSFFNRIRNIGLAFLKLKNLPRSIFGLFIMRKAAEQQKS